MTYALDTLEKQPAESRLYSFDFSARMSDAEEIVSVDSFVISPAGLSATTPVFSGKVVQARLSGGADGTKYKITVIVTTSLGNILELDGFLFVKER